MENLKGNIEETFDFLNHFYALKEIEREGWKRKLVIKNVESVAEHTLSMIAIITLFADRNNFTPSKTLKMIKMILLHDLGESIIGDHTPDSIKIEEKKKIENNAIAKIISKIPFTEIKNKYIKIWEEFDENKTEISKLVHIFDKLDLMIQAKYYLDNNNKKVNEKDIKPFFESATRYINNNKLRIEKKKDFTIDSRNTGIDNEIEQILLYLNN
jgi:putative hydrolase of HD superfamily